MKSKFIFTWADLIEAFRPASSLMMLQGVVCLLFAHTDQWIAWGKGSVLIGVLFWVGWAVAKQIGALKNHAARDAGFWSSSDGLYAKRTPSGSIPKSFQLERF